MPSLFLADGQQGQRIVSANGSDWTDLQVGKEGEVYPAWRFVVATASCCAVVLAILVLVLAKEAPQISLPAVMSEPGGLGRLLEPLNPWATP